MSSKYIVRQIWGLLKRKIGTFKILVNIRGAGPRPRKDRCTRKVFLSIETVHISLVPFYRKKSRRLSVPACKYSLPSGAYSLSSILKLFRYSKFITGLLPPSLLDTGNRLLRYELLHDDTGCIAPFTKIC